jgi:serine/threonine-protein kinase
MAEVYKARLADSQGPDRVLVVKLLPRDADSQTAARFVDEAKIALPLTHGNITATFEFGQADNRSFLVMEYVHGGSLRHLLQRLEGREETLQVPTTIFLAREIARALRYAHHFRDVTGQPSPVVHCDVSPDNVLLSFSGQVKLTDFGIARTKGSLASDGAWGKPAYVAPEILEGAPGTPAADIYSLGCVMYEMLSGVPPLLGRTEAETLPLVRDWMPEPLEQLRNDLPLGLSELVLSMLSKAPGQRAVDAAELEVTLTALLAKEAPHFTETHLAVAVTRVLEGYQPQDSSSDDVVLAERLREQLQEAGIETAGGESTADMLAFGTVPLSAVQAPPAPGLPRPPSATEYVDTKPLPRSSAALLAEQEPPGRPPWVRRALFVALLLPSLALASWAFVSSVARSSGNGEGKPSLPGELPTAFAIAAAPPVSNVAPKEDHRDPQASPSAADSGGSDSSDRPATPPESSPDEPATEDAGPTSASSQAARRKGRAARRRQRRRKSSTVTFNSQPWSFVTVDGRRLPGHTPVRKVKLAPGRHRVQFYNPELGLKRSLTIRLNPGEERFVKVRLQE